MPINKIITIPKLNIEVEFVIGKNAQDNFNIIDNAEPHHIWFHIEGQSSCHVIAKLEEPLDRKNVKYVIKQGAVLCKQHSKQNNQKNVPIVYTNIENVTKSNTTGSVVIQNQKMINI